MTIRAAILLLLPLVAFGQTPPPEVDQALRARATEFFQDFVEGKYSKAFVLVAEDSQDAFFSSGKAELKSFKIDSIKYSADFAKATVNFIVKRPWRFQGEEAMAEVPMATSWKTEDGKWVWTNEIQPGAWLTAMGPSNVEVVTRKSETPITGVPDKINQDTVNALGMRILQQAGGLDKSEVTLSASQSSSDTVVFHNGAPGSVRLELSVPKIPGLSAKLDKADLNYGESVALHIQYEPSPNRDKEAAPPPATLALVVTPLNQQLTVHVNFK
jgi:hypothetical protein